MDKLPKYRRAVWDGLTEISKLVAKRRELDDKINKLNKLLEANINMLPDDEQEIFAVRLIDAIPASGLSDAILRVVKGKFLSTTGVREALMEKGYDLTGHVNPLASIHTTLKRLHESGRISLKKAPDGKVFYGRTESDKPRSKK